MTTLSCIKHLGSAAFALLAAVSCNSLIFDQEEDCTVHYRLKFRYDMNLKFADAFAHEVESVSVYAFDAEGELVWQATERSDALAADDYTMQLDLAPGTYRLVAWCGLDGRDSFCLPEASADCRAEDLHCRLSCVSSAEGSASPAQSDSDLHPLFHGLLDVELPDGTDGREYIYEMSLTKDTNVFRVVLQHLSGEDLSADDFEFGIEDCNGWLAYDNSPLRDEPVVYRPWAVYSGQAGVGSSDRALTAVRVVVAEMTVSRLFVRDWTQYRRPALVIRTAADGALVASVPVIDYALLVKGAHYSQMDDQEYLDRADQYNMTFFLDSSNHWISTVIEVLSWRVVVNSADLNG